LGTKTYRAVILDMDGVVTRTADVHARSWKEMFDAYLREREGAAFTPFDIDRDYRRYVDGKPRYDGVQSFLESRGIELPYGAPDDPPGRETVCGLGNTKNELFHEVLKRDGVAVYDDTVDRMTQWRRQGLKVALITSSRNCRDVLDAAGLQGWFDVTVDGNDAHRLGIEGKPAPDIFLYAAKELGIAPEEAVVVEDALSGVEAGRAGGFGLVVGVAREGAQEGLMEAGADCVVHDMRAVRTSGEFPPTITCDDDAPVPALDRWDAIADRLDRNELALFLDYDGTLTPIVPQPEDATLSDTMRALLTRLSKLCTVAVVSGRDRRDVESMVGHPDLVYAGSHGFDIRGPGGFAMEQEDAQDALGALDDAEKGLRERLASIEGARVERKKFAIAVHYRGVSGETDIATVEQAVDQAVSTHSALRKKGGKKIFELQPNVEWDKGHAVMFLADALDLNRDNVVLMYIGDDVTDEDAFRALRATPRGIGVRVADEVADTAAHYMLRACGEVADFLDRIATTLDRPE